MNGDTYDTNALYEVADLPATEVAHVAASGPVTGVALPDRYGGVLLSASAARRLGAQLIIAADLHDAIQDAALEPPPARRSIA